MKTIRPFQIFLLAGFAVLAIVAVVLLTNFRPGSDKDINPYGQRVVVWGFLEATAINKVFSDIAELDDNFDVVEYTQVDERNFEGRLVNAVAEGFSPDLVLISHEQLVRLRSKLIGLEYDERIFRDRYVDGAEIFTLSDGQYAFPLGVDPLVMYWNRDMFSSNGLAQAPSTWELLVSSVVPTLTIRDNNRTITRSALAFGEFRNIRHAQSILSMLMLQSGSKMVEEGERGYVVALNKTPSEAARPPMEAAVQFYTDFSNPNSPAFTWNRAQPTDRDAFVSSDLATYFGFGSEVVRLSEQNPNLNFDVASVPQGASSNVKRNFGKFYGLAIPRASSNINGAVAAAAVITDTENAATLNNELLLAPVDRRTLAAGSNNAFSQVIFNAALISRGWLDPDPAATAGILQTMIEDVVSSRVRVSAAVTDAVNRITLSF